MAELVGCDKERNAAQFRASKFCFAARVAGQAREVDYPDLESLVARVLALRMSPQEDTPARVTEAHAATALVLALADPATARQILPDVFDLLALPGGPPSGLTLISGPSKTGDIEGKLVTGVHGPREVHVIVIRG